MNNSKDIQNANSGCFSSILRRLLCSDNPSDSYHTITESKPAEFNNLQKIKDAKMVNEANVQNPTNINNPGVVAKLMGLDSLPVVDTNLGPNGKSPELVTRSRSVNFMDYLLKQQTDMTQTMPRHRRLKTSVSFRENQDKKSQQLFVLFLNDVDETKKKDSKVKESQDEKGKRRKSLRNKALDDQECREETKMKNVSRRVSSKHFNCNGNKDSSVVMTRKKNFDRKDEGGINAIRSPLKTIEQKEVSAESKLMKNKKLKTKKKNQPIVRKKDHEGSSATSSADSVLDLDNFVLQYETELSEYTESIDLDSVRFTSSLQYAKEVEASKNGKNTELYTELVVKLIKLTEEDITKLNLVSTVTPIRYEDYEEICVEVEQEILNLFIQQFVDELGKT